MGALKAVLLLFLLFWSAITLGVDGMIFQGLARQSRAAFYPHVPGTITHSQVVKRTGDEGSTYGFEVRYAYAVDGREYEGTHYRYGSSGLEGCAAGTLCPGHLR